MLNKQKKRVGFMLMAVALELVINLHMVLVLQDGAVSNVPTITTYKAIKRGTSSITTTTTTSPDPRQKRQATTPPMATVAPVSPNKLPQSLRNIRKLSSGLNDDHIESVRSVMFQ